MIVTDTGKEALEALAEESDADFLAAQLVLATQPPPQRIGS